MAVIQSVINETAGEGIEAGGLCVEGGGAGISN